MAKWVYPSDKRIIGTTKIKDADDFIQSALDDFNDWINGDGVYTTNSFDNDIKTYITDYIDGYFASYSDNTVAVEW